MNIFQHLYNENKKEEKLAYTHTITKGKTDEMHYGRQNSINFWTVSKFKRRLNTPVSQPVFIEIPFGIKTVLFQVEQRNPVETVLECNFYIEFQIWMKMKVDFPVEAENIFQWGGGSH